jgi:antitoxin Phd
MKTMTARDAKNRFGELLDVAQREAVTIQKRGRPVAVLLSQEQYAHLEAVEDAAWAARADAASRTGFIGPERSQALLQELLDAEA